MKEERKKEKWTSVKKERKSQEVAVNRMKKEKKEEKKETREAKCDSNEEINK